MSTCDTSLSSPLCPVFPKNAGHGEIPPVQAVIDALALQKHVEGGYYVETDRDQRRVPNPFISDNPEELEGKEQIDKSTRSASTTIYYMITPSNPLGAFHRNKGRTIHTLHKGRGRYVVIHADEVLGDGLKARVETFVVGHNLQGGETLQWIVEGGKFKASYLLPDEEVGECTSKGLLISETVVPGFEFEDHDFMNDETLDRLVTPEQRDELSWLLRDDALA